MSTMIFIGLVFKYPGGGVRYTFLVFLMLTLKRVINIVTVSSVCSSSTVRPKSFLLQNEIQKRNEQERRERFIFSPSFFPNEA